MEFPVLIAKVTDLHFLYNPVPSYEATCTKSHSETLWKWRNSSKVRGKQKLKVYHMLAWKWEQVTQDNRQTDEKTHKEEKEEEEDREVAQCVKWWPCECETLCLLAQHPSEWKMEDPWGAMLSSRSQRYCLTKKVDSSSGMTRSVDHTHVCEPAQTHAHECQRWHTMHTWKTETETKSHKGSTDTLCLLVRSMLKLRPKRGIQIITQQSC